MSTYITTGIDCKQCGRDWWEVDAEGNKGCIHCDKQAYLKSIANKEVVQVTCQHCEKSWMAPQEIALFFGRDATICVDCLYPDKPEKVSTAIAARRCRAMTLLIYLQIFHADTMDDEALVTELLVDMLALAGVSALHFNFDACLSRARATHKQESEK